MQPVELCHKDQLKLGGIRHTAVPAHIATTLDKQPRVPEKAPVMEVFNVQYRHKGR